MCRQLPRTDLHTDQGGRLSGVMGNLVVPADPTWGRENPDEIRLTW